MGSKHTWTPRSEMNHGSGIKGWKLKKCISVFDVDYKLNYVWGIPADDIVY